jgi:predicted transposase YbfD/YdcC
MLPNPSLPDISTLPPSALLHHSLRLIPDPRDQRRPKHALPDLLFIALCSLLSGGDSFLDMADFARDEAAWLRTVIPFTGGPPSHDTFTRVFALLDTHAFEQAVRHWMRQLLLVIPPPAAAAPPAPATSSPSPSLQRQIAVDGKTLRGSRRGAPGALQMAATVNVWSIEEGLCLAQRRIPEASGEGPQCELLLRHLQLKGVILSGDAAHCQHSLASHLTAQGGDYVLNLKGNQPDAKAEIHPLLETLAASRPPDLEQTEKGHGRIEIRRCWVTGDLAALACRGQWSGLTSLALCERETHDLITGKITIGQRFFITSLKPEASLIARCVRHHWQVENNLHWRLDVIFREDFQRCRSGYAATNLSLLRKMSLNLLLKACPKGMSLKRMRLRTARKLDHLTKIIAPLLETNPNFVNA